ncbi:Carboxyl transferase domain [seawater metagenome]|uniref:Carboxyl transferase domain n=1 Tax=seawater metagenome TaxID=1561972 RepID=A0A5E8CJC1_9ZZZZ
MNVNNILITNRGLPAIKFINSIREWIMLEDRHIILKCIATPDDLNSNYKYLDYADEVIYSNDNNIYKSIEGIIKICKNNDIQAVWPGWGYLSEEPDFSQALNDNNIIFIGPSAYSLNLLGDKVECMKLADSINIPQLPWSKNCSNDINFLKKHALEIGLPVILKSSNGGGGKGIRILENINDIENIVYQIKSESTGEIFVMKLAKECKHLEVQIVSDGENVITLGTRDCSIQRRRQKLVEEAPASYPKANIIKLMEESAIKIVKEVGLKGVCTVEFLLEDTDNLSFMEVNPRLQVEHIVTETIFSLNLPSIQVLLAEGKKINEIEALLKPTIRGHAISCRINSENAYECFKPITGKITGISYNTSPNTWAYFAVNNNSKIGEAVDNQFGHVVAWGETREIARKRMFLFLDNLIITSEVINTANFLKNLLKEDMFINENHNVTWLDNRKFNFNTNNEFIIISSLIVKAYSLFKIDLVKKEEMTSNGHKNIDRYFNEYYKIELVANNLIYEALISFSNFPHVEIINNSNNYKFKFQVHGKFFYLFSGDNKIFSINTNHIDDFGIKTNISRHSYNLYHPVNPNEIRASVGGKITKVNFKQNEFIKKGQTALIVEIMKMAVDITSPLDGNINYCIKEDEKIEKNQLLFTIKNGENNIKLSKGVFKTLNKYLIESKAIEKPISNLKKCLTKQEVCKKLNTTYIYDLIEYFDYKKIDELVLNVNNELDIQPYQPNSNTESTILAFYVQLLNGQDFILIANDITVQAGSFSWKDDIVFLKASEYARKYKLPRIYISSNSGARLELNSKIREHFKIKWKNDCPQDGFEFIYLDEEDNLRFQNDVVIEEKIIDKIKYNVITGIKNQGVKNLNGSALIASETSKAFEEIFTLTYVTGRTVGIGAYLTKLGMRTIQKKDSPIILTGNMALNKVLGMNVYQNNLEIGGPHIMEVNSTTHLVVNDDKEGIKKIQEWLGFLNINQNYISSISPTSIPQNIKQFINFFFDNENKLELFNNWGGSIIGGKARLYGYPVTYLACNEELSVTNIPVDPGDINSSIIKKNNPGLILNNDASQKVAQLIRESNIEGLPLIFLVNLRGFSGGTKDLLDQVLTHGSDIVRYLSTYDKPFYIYLLPNSQLRGGAMVVISKFINIQNIEIYADPSAKSNILEPDGLKEIKFRKKDIIKKINQNNLDSTNETIYNNFDKVALHFCSLHDKIDFTSDDFDGKVDWKDSRHFFGEKIKKYFSKDT